MCDADHKHDQDASKTGTSGKGGGPALEWHDGDMPFSPLFRDHYYSKADGRAECNHVFIGANRLAERWPKNDTFRIGELGFGTGLNFCETARQFRLASPPDARLEFISFERFPMKGSEIAKALSHWPEIQQEANALVENWQDSPDDDVIEIAFAPNIRLQIFCGDAFERLSGFPGACDAWFLDGFAPSRNPDMWTGPLMQAVFDHTVTGGTFATYTAAGFVRRHLMAAGFEVEKRPGFAGKREMLAGIRPASGNV